jgi:hypothetical protein
MPERVTAESRSRRIGSFGEQQIGITDSANAGHSTEMPGRSHSRSANNETADAELIRAERHTDAVLGELLHRMSRAHGGGTDFSSLHDLLAVTLGALDLARNVATRDARALVDDVTAVTNTAPREIEQALTATLDRTCDVLDRSAPIDRVVARIVARLREIEERERDLAALRDEVLAEAGELLANVHELRDAVGVLAATGEHARATAPTQPARRL